MKLGITLLLFFVNISTVLSFDAKKDTLYYNANWELTVKNKATYCRLTTVKNGVYEGSFKDLLINDSISISSGNYKNAKLSGEYIKRNSNENVLIKGFFENGKKKGIWTFYYATGKPLIKMEYTDGKKKVLEFYNSKNTQTLQNGNGEIDHLVLIGSKQCRLNGKFKNGLKHGKWIFVSTVDDKVVLTEKYSNDSFLIGKNLLNKKTTTKPLLSIDDLFFSDHLYVTNRYTLSSEVSYKQIPKINNFFTHLDNYSYVINKESFKGFPDDRIIAIEIDKFGFIWFVTEYKGIFCLKNKTVYSYGTDNWDRLFEAKIHADKDGEIWVPYKNRRDYSKSGLIHIVNDSLRLLNTKNSGLTCNYITSISSVNDSILIGADNCINIFNKNSKKWSKLFNPKIHKTKYDTIQLDSKSKYNSFYFNKAYNYCKAIKSYNGKIWVGTYDGLFIYGDNKIEHYEEDVNSFISNNWIGSFCEKNNGLLMAFSGSVDDGGLLYYKEDKWENINPSNSVIKSNYINKVRGGVGNEIWMNSKSNALYMMKEKRIVRFGYDQKNYKNIINDFVIDREGNVFLATNKGILLLLHKDL